VRIKKSLAALTTGIVATTTFGIAVPASADTGTTGEVTAALDAVDARNGNLVVEPVPSTTDSNSAAQTATVDIPIDLTQGVKLGSPNGKHLTIRVPDARKKDRGKKSRDDVVVYNSSANSVDAAIPTADGVQLWKHIRNKNANENFRYCVDGVNFQVLSNGAAIGLDQANQPVTLVPPPTATEKRTGKSIPTSYKAESDCLVQHVAHKAKGTSYPVVADPAFLVVVAAWLFRSAVISCGLGYLSGAAQQWWMHGWVWQEVRRAGREGCVWGMIWPF
jgi:hypothetical protein